MNTLHYISIKSFKPVTYLCIYLSASVYSYYMYMIICFQICLSGSLFACFLST